MRKKVFGRKLARDRGSREALFKSLIEALAMNGKITTTKAKAKAIQGELDGMLVLAKKNEVHSMRLLASRLNNKKYVLDKLVEQAKLSDTRNSGFTRIIALPPRRGDRAEIARIEFVDKISDKPQVESKKSKSKVKTEDKKDK